MPEDLASPLTIADLAVRVGMGERSLKRAFRDVHGVSVFAFFPAAHHCGERYSPGNENAPQIRRTPMPRLSPNASSGCATRWRECGARQRPAGWASRPAQIPRAATAAVVAAADILRGDIETPLRLGELARRVGLSRTCRTSGAHGFAGGGRFLY